MIVVVMGVAGSGKSTVGRALAARLGARFVEGDAYHSAASREKMAAGVALGDADRWPWLDALGAEIARAAAAGDAAVLACSALRRRYRDRLRAACPELRLAYLAAPEALLAERLSGRRGHYMPASLLASQLETLEVPGADERAVVVDVRATPEAIAVRIEAALRAGGAP